ncbi:tetratricopeptide repeat protein 39B-like protein [Leptotrombidium deliense]|uniref:Tetratricopeptide repeat protein 39B-like protein n=1 Tax=Leptotrombidium deliense TaxID=299467 RepID=A0A443RWD9_9ACAR|nr:tetratricopeptide repeat protein 39B-like protein [Leptotrombidium deliense]
MLSDKKFECEELKEQLESGVYNGLGAFNLVLSMVPKKIMRILTVAGFSGDKNIALAMIKRSTDLKSGLRCRVSVIVVEAFAMYFEQVMGIQEIDNNFMKSLLDYWGERFPKAVFVLFYLGKYELMRGNPKKAITDYTTCIGLQNEWKFVQKICRWDLVWCYSFLGDWEGAINEAKSLVECSLYSPATNEYQIAVFKMMQMEDNGNDDLRREVDELMK